MMNFEEKILSLLEGIQGEQRQTNERLVRIETDVSGLKDDFAGMKGEMSGLKDDFAGLKGEMSELKSNFARLEKSHVELAATVKQLGERVEGIEGRLDGFEERFDGIDKRFDGIDKRFDGVDKRFDVLEAKVDEHGQAIERLEEGQRELAQTVGRIDRAVIHIENVHGEKLAALFDGYKANAAKEQLLEPRVTKLEKLYERHSVEIAALRNAQ